MVVNFVCDCVGKSARRIYFAVEHLRYGSHTEFSGNPDYSCCLNAFVLVNPAHFHNVADIEKHNDILKCCRYLFNHCGFVCGKAERFNRVVCALGTCAADYDYCRVGISNCVFEKLIRQVLRVHFFKCVLCKKHLEKVVDNRVVGFGKLV